MAEAPRLAPVLARSASEGHSRTDLKRERGIRRLKSERGLRDGNGHRLLRRSNRGAARGPSLALRADIGNARSFADSSGWNRERPLPRWRKIVL
jgi:hypothetical protein